MKTVSFLKSPSYLLLGLFSILLVIGTRISAPSVYHHERVLISPPPIIKHLSFGYKESLADVFWIRAVQDFDYCSKVIAANVCANESWLFDMVDLITDLSPSFHSAYLYGALSLSIIITDVEGARRIYEKAVLQFPEDWKLAYYAAYHYIYEVKDKKRAAELLKIAGAHGAPDWVYVLAGRMYSESGEVQMAEGVLQNMIETKQNPLLIERLRKKIDDMRKKNQTQ